MAAWHVKRDGWAFCHDTRNPNRHSLDSTHRSQQVEILMVHENDSGRNGCEFAHELVESALHPVCDSATSASLDELRARGSRIPERTPSSSKARHGLRQKPASVCPKASLFQPPGVETSAEFSYWVRGLQSHADFYNTAPSDFDQGEISVASVSTFE